MIRGFFVVVIIYLIVPVFPWWILWVILALYGGFLSDYKESIYHSVIIALISWGVILGISYFTGGSVLMSRMSHMLGLGSTFYLILISLMLAGLLGGLSGVSGYHIKLLIDLFIFKPK